MPNKMGGGFSAPLSFLIMDFEDILAFLGIAIGIVFLTMVVLTSLDLWRLHREGAPPRAYAERVCAPVGFLVRQPARLLQYLGDPGNLSQEIEALSLALTRGCEDLATHFFAKKLNPSPPQEGLRREAI